MRVKRIEPPSKSEIKTELEDIKGRLKIAHFKASKELLPQHVESDVINELYVHFNGVITMGMKPIGRAELL